MIIGRPVLAISSDKSFCISANSNILSVNPGRPCLVLGSYCSTVELSELVEVRIILSITVYRRALKVQESCAIAKMTARRALYKWIVVVEIWPFEIIEDGGLPPTWIRCNRK